MKRRNRNTVARRAALLLLFALLLSALASCGIPEAVLSEDLRTIYLYGRSQMALGALDEYKVEERFEVLQTVGDGEKTATRGVGVASMVRGGTREMRYLSTVETETGLTLGGVDEMVTFETTVESEGYQQGEMHLAVSSDLRTGYRYRSPISAEEYRAHMEERSVGAPLFGPSGNCIDLHSAKSADGKTWTLTYGGYVGEDLGEFTAWANEWIGTVAYRVVPVDFSVTYVMSAKDFLPISKEVSFGLVSTDASAEEIDLRYRAETVYGVPSLIDAIHSWSLEDYEEVSDLRLVDRAKRDLAEIPLLEDGSAVIEEHFRGGLSVAEGVYRLHGARLDGKFTCEIESELIKPAIDAGTVTERYGGGVCTRTEADGTVTESDCTEAEARMVFGSYLLPFLLPARSVQRIEIGAGSEKGTTTVTFFFDDPYAEEGFDGTVDTALLVNYGTDGLPRYCTYLQEYFDEDGTSVGTYTYVCRSFDGERTWGTEDGGNT